MRYKWIDVSLYSTDMAEFYVMNQTLTSDKVKYMIGNIRSMANLVILNIIINAVENATNARQQLFLYE